LVIYAVRYEDGSVWKENEENRVAQITAKAAAAGGGGGG
jgi:hypothetical protein